MKFRFYGGTGIKYRVVNYLINDRDDIRVYAECEIPNEIAEEAAEDFGYVTMKRAILKAMEAEGLDTEGIEWPYRRDDSTLRPESFANCEVYVSIEDYS